MQEARTELRKDYHYLYYSDYCPHLHCYLYNVSAEVPESDKKVPESEKVPKSDKKYLKKAEGHIG